MGRGIAQQLGTAESMSAGSPVTKRLKKLACVQIEDLAQARAELIEALDIVACDGKYGNAGFLRTVKGQALRDCDPLTLRSGVVSARHHRVNPRNAVATKLHGKRFAFKEPDTWGEPDEVVELDDPYWGQVRLECWHHLHEKKGADVPYDVVRASVHREREKPPAALWLAWLPPQHDPDRIDGDCPNHLARV